MAARELAGALEAKGWRFWQPSTEDATTQTAKLSKTIEGQGVKQVDFLSQLIGLDSDGVRRRAVEIHLADGTQPKVLHPIDVLESRLRNLAALSRAAHENGLKLAAVLVLPLQSSLSWAQQAQPQTYPYGGHMMWSGGWLGMFFGLVSMFLLLVAVIGGIALVARWFGAPRYDGQPPQGLVHSRIAATASSRFTRTDRDAPLDSRYLATSRGSARSPK